MAPYISYMDDATVQVKHMFDLLPNCEHAATGAPQVVPANSASKELFEDCSSLIPINQEIVMERILTRGGLVKPEDVATKLDELYTNKELYNTLADKCYSKFTNLKYSWLTIGKMWDELFKEII